MFSIAENNGITVLLYDPNQVQNPAMTNEVRHINYKNLQISFSSLDGIALGKCFLNVIRTLALFYFYVFICISLKKLALQIAA